MLADPLQPVEWPRPHVTVPMSLPISNTALLGGGGVNQFLT